MRVVSDWALASSPLRREALARALAQPATFVGGDAAIEHLAADPATAVRRQAARAAACRLDANPRRFRPLLSRLAFESDSKVRGTARRCLAESSHNRALTERTSSCCRRQRTARQPITPTT